MMGGERGGATASVATRLFTTPPRRLVDWLVDSIEDSFSNAPREEGGVLGSSWEDKSGDNKRGFPGSILVRLKRGAGRAKRLNSCANGN